MEGDLYSLGKLLYWIVTGGGYFEREDVDAAVGQIVGSTDLHRHYLAQLVRGLVVYEAAARWDANSLVGKLDDFSRLIDRLSMAEVRGEAVLQDRLGPDDEFSANAMNLIYSDAPGHVGRRERAEYFTVPDEMSLRLTQLSIGLSAEVGGEAWLSMVPDDDGIPSQSRVVARWQVSIPASRSLVGIPAAAGVELAGGSGYWIGLTAEPGTAVRWWTGWEELRPLPSLSVERDDVSDWRRQASEGGPGPALRITGSPQ
jgi:hypothetical protein